MSSALLPLVVIGGCYVAWGIPFGLLLAKLFYQVDVRQSGSGNIGATNVWRVCGWRLGLTVFLLDVAKGFFAVSVARSTVPAASAWLPAVAGVAAMLGHSLSPFLGFKGGRGVAAGLGVVLGLSWWVALVAFGIWAVTLLATRYVSVASIFAAIVCSALFWFAGGAPLAPRAFVIAVTLIIVVRHVPNLRRLLRGTEPRIWARGQNEPVAAAGSPPGEPNTSD